MRIGEVLLLRESVDALVLSQTVREQIETGQRFVSILISRALIESDEGALALSEQTGFPAALQRHLEGRDAAVVDALPAQLAKTWVVVPLGRSHHGDLVVCARDPTPILAAALEHATRGKVKLAVAPAMHVERLVRSIYGASGRPDTPLPIVPPSLGDIGQSTVGETTQSPRRARTVSKSFIDTGDSGPVRVPMRSMSALEITLQEIDGAFSVIAVERMVMSYVSGRWQSALLFAIADGVASATRNHVGAVDGIVVPLAAPSLIQIACGTRSVASDSPDSAVHQHLMSLLGAPTTPLAAPIVWRGEVRAVLVIGDAIEGRHRDSIVELDRLADALGAAYARFGRSGL